MRKLPGRTVTFLFTDGEGSTRLLRELGDRYADALAEHRRALREAFARHGGVEVDTQGDAFFYAFERASAAVTAAAEGQAALAGGRRPRRASRGAHRRGRSRRAGACLGDDGAARRGAAARPRRARLKDLTAPQRLFQPGDGEFPRLKTLYQTNLPVPATPFLGRGRELAEVAELLGGERLVTLTGAGGSGKTRLALQSAGAAADGFPQGVWWVRSRR
jgi:hypothetical protein